MAAEEFGSVCQTLAIVLTFRGTSALDGPALNAIRRHLSSVVVREVNTLDQSPYPVQSSSDEGEITTFATIPLVFKRPCLMCLAINSPLDFKILRCGHLVCRACVQARFKLAIDQELSYPAECCEVIEPEEVESLLDEASIQKYKEKEIEYQCTDRTYCHVRACQKFLPPTHISHGVAACEDCSTYTCVGCKEEVHMDGCIVTEEETQLWKTVNENGWRRCKCGRVFERYDGCNHMTCAFCGAEWCYACGVPWSRLGQPPHDPFCGNTNRGRDPEFDDEEDEHDNMIDLPEPDNENIEHSIAGEECDPHGDEGNGGPSGENGPPADSEAQQGTDLIPAQVEQPHEVVNPYLGPTPEQRNCMHRDAWHRRSVSSLCQVCQWYANLYIFRCFDCNLSACWDCTVSGRLRELRDNVPPEEVRLPWGGDREAQLLAEDRWAEVDGSVAGPSTDALGPDFTEVDAQAHAEDANDKVQKAREHMAAMQEQFLEAQKRFMLAEEGLELVSLDNEAAVRLLGQFGN